MKILHRITGEVLLELSGASLFGAELRGADLRSADISKVKLGFGYVKIKLLD